MKKLIYSILSMLFLITSGFAMAQDTTTAPKPHPRIHEVHKRMKMQLERINAGVANGKLTTAQAQALKDQLKAVQAQMDADYQANGNRVLTEAQKTQLNQMLDANSKTIYTEKNPNGVGANGGESSPGNLPSTGTGSTVPMNQ